MREDATRHVASDRAAAAVRRAMGQFLQRFAWTHFLTLTYEREAGPLRARRDFVDGFVRRVAFEAAQPVRWFYVLEGGGDDGRRLHIHALVSDTAHLPIARVERAWRGGITDVRVYDASRGATYYLAKTLGDVGHDQFDLSSKLPPLLRCAA